LSVKAFLGEVQHVGKADDEDNSSANPVGTGLRFVELLASTFVRIMWFIRNITVTVMPVFIDPSVNGHCNYIVIINQLKYNNFFLSKNPPTRVNDCSMKQIISSSAPQSPMDEGNYHDHHVVCI
jgi:hypothetical protein